VVFGVRGDSQAEACGARGESAFSSTASDALRLWPGPVLESLRQEKKKRKNKNEKRKKKKGSCPSHACNEHRLLLRA